MITVRSCFAIVFLIGIASVCFSQGSDNYGKGLRVELDESGNKYVRFIMWNQIWMRSTANNPNSLVNDDPSNHTLDVGARRLRFLAYAQITPRFLFLTHFGINNQTFNSGGGSGTSGTGGYGAGKKPQLFFHDAWGEFAVIPTQNTRLNKANPVSLFIGSGMHYWNGISRMTSGSTLNFLAIDAPIFNWPLVDVSDQFARQFGVYAKGTAARLNYSLAVNKPFATNQDPLYDELKGPQAVDNSGNPDLSVQGYFDYQFLDKEIMTLPFRVGTYMGTRRVLNVGAGFYHAGDATKSLTSTGTVQSHNINLFGVDVFADLPFGPKEKKMAFTGYAVYYDYDFGPNYIRTVGIMNPSNAFAAGTTNNAIQGPGNSRFLLGTGSIFYAQAGLLLPKLNPDRKSSRLQPFVAYTNKKLDYLDETGHYFDFGANIFIDGHHAKITPQYSTRPLYYQDAGRRVVNGNRGEFLIQLQVYL